MTAHVLKARADAPVNSPGSAAARSEDTPCLCPTRLVDDSPASSDTFSSDEDIGPHRRVARAIVEVVVSERGGRAIGLEGSWGSGKSTVVQLVRSQLEENESCEVICFDAWAHEGDPLRRTYLAPARRDERAVNRPNAGERASLSPLHSRWPLHSWRFNDPEAEGVWGNLR